MKTKGKPNEMDIEIGKNLKKIRNFRQISQDHLSKKIGVSYQQLQKYENAENKVSASRLALLADALEVPITSLYPKKYQIISERFLRRFLYDME